MKINSIKYNNYNNYVNFKQISLDEREIKESTALIEKIKKETVPKKINILKIKKFHRQ